MLFLLPRLFDFLFYPAPFPPYVLLSVPVQQDTAVTMLIPPLDYSSVFLSFSPGDEQLGFCKKDTVIQ